MEGGKLSFDTANRKPISRNAIQDIPSPWTWKSSNKYTTMVKDAWNWACEMFPDHHGPPTDAPLRDVIQRLKPFALTTKHAEASLKHFVKHRLTLFGTYEDAIPLPSETTFVYHSNLSHALNNGLLSPRRFIYAVEHWYKQHATTTKLA